MSKTSLFLFLSLVATQLFAQVKFRPGYYVNNQNEKISCFIKDIDQIKSPTSFEFKLSEDSNTETLGINQVKEFAIIGQNPFVRNKVKIDRSYSNLRNLSSSKEPSYTEEVLFLRKIVSGEATLYKYNETNFERFFYTTTARPTVEQLVFKKFKSGEQVGENTLFRRQLWIHVRCKEQKNSMAIIEKLDYYEDELTRYFIAYNSCKNSDVNNDQTALVESTNETTAKRSGTFNLSIRPGVYSADLSFQNIREVDVNFDNKFGYRVGLELEFVFPFNNGKWSAFIEPTYQKYSNEEMASNILTATIDYSSIELPFGIRYYSFLNDKNKLFFNLGVLVDIPQKDGIDFNFNDDPEFANANNLIVGIGYEFDSKFNVEFRYGTNRDFIASGIWKANFTTATLIAGYKIKLN